MICKQSLQNKSAMLGASAQNSLLPAGCGLAYASRQSRSLVWSTRGSFFRKGRLITSKRIRSPHARTWKQAVPCATFTVSKVSNRNVPGSISHDRKCCSSSKSTSIFLRDKRTLQLEAALRGKSAMQCRKLDRAHLQ